MLRAAGYDDLAAQLEVLARARTQEIEGGTVEASLADRTAAAFYRAGVAGPRV